MPFYKLKELDPREIVAGYRARFVHSEKMTTAYWEVDKGAALPSHSHPHEQVSNVIEGKFEFDLDGDRRVIGPGDVVIIPPGVSHGGKAVEKCRIIDTFYPVREDYL